MGINTNKSPSGQRALKRQKARHGRAFNPYSKEAKAEDKKRRQLLSDERLKEARLRTERLRCDFGTKDCRRCKEGTGYKKGHDPTCLECSKKRYKPMPPSQVTNVPDPIASFQAFQAFQTHQALNYHPPLVSSVSTVLSASSHGQAKSQKEYQCSCHRAHREGAKKGRIAHEPQCLVQRLMKQQSLP